MRLGHTVRRMTYVLALIVLSCLLVGPLLADGPLYTPSERLGVSFLIRLETPDGWINQSIATYDLAALSPGWYTDWSFGASPEMPADMQGADAPEYAQLIRVSNRAWEPDWSAVQNAVELNTGALWLIGNEPECPNQDAVTPEVYAERYHTAYVKIKGWDPTARVANGAIVEVTPLRLAWLDQVLDSYQSMYGEAMPVDVWNIHVQILSEGSDTDPKAGAGVPVFTVGMEPIGLLPKQFGDLRDNASLPIFQTMIWDFRDWMYLNGQQSKELVISEMGVLFPSEYLVPEGYTGDDPEDAGDRVVEAFMIGAIDWLNTETDEAVGCPTDEYRLVQRYLWYALNDHFYWRQDGSASGFNGSLWNHETGEPTRFGRQLIAYENRFRDLHRVVVPLAINP